MAVDQKKRQKKLAKKKAKRKEAHSKQKTRISFGDKINRTKALIIAKSSPIKECLIRKDIFDAGIGTAVIVREMPNDYFAAGVYLLDVWCLGIKNAYFTTLSKIELDDRINEIENNEKLENIHPSCLRKLIDECVDYSEKLGFKPHKDFKIPQQLLTDIDSTVCPMTFNFGKDGKPFYFSGPNENEQQQKRIYNSLMQNCGEGNFDFVMGLGDMDFD